MRQHPFVLALAANEIALGSGQKNAVDARIVFGAVQEFLLETGGSYVVDDEPAAGHKTRHYEFIDLSVVLRWLDVGEAKCERLGTAGIIKSVAVKYLN